MSPRLIKLEHKQSDVPPLEEGDTLVGFLALDLKGQLIVCFDEHFVKLADIEMVDEITASVREYLLRCKGILQ